MLTVNRTEDMLKAVSSYSPQPDGPSQGGGRRITYLYYVCIYIYIYRRLGGVSSPLGRPPVTGKSFRVVRACARVVRACARSLCQVEMHLKCEPGPFPFPFRLDGLSVFPQ